MHRTWLTRAAAWLGAAAAVVLMAGAARRAPTELRVCVDPYDMPFSNDKEEGFENKIAHVVARDLNAAVVNFWWPQRRGVLRSPLLAGFCDVMNEPPLRVASVATTKRYYRPTYHFVYPPDVS